jgi:hypothetical protein
MAISKPVTKTSISVIKCTASNNRNKQREYGHYKVREKDREKLPAATHNL